MIDEIKKMVENYQNWMNKSITLKQFDDWIEITTPFLDRHNDFIQIYVRKFNDEYILTDDGYTIQDLSLSGCSIDTDKRKLLLKTSINGFGVKNDNNILKITANEKNFPVKKHNLIQAILAVNDLFYLAEPRVAKVFIEKVTEWLDENDVRYSPKVKFSGASGYDHVFDFIIPKSRDQPERILQAINNPNKINAENFIFSYIDMKNNRDVESRAYTVLNDEERIPIDVPNAFANYEIKAFGWTDRDLYVAELVA